jgi:hypothetical protein
MMITDSDALLDLAPEYESTGKSIIDDDEACVDYQSLWERSRAGRKPPESPDVFDEILETLHFTNGADKDFVKNKYRKTFHEVLNTASELWFAELGWTDEDAKLLSEILPLCHMLTQLNLMGNSITSVGAMALISKASKCPKLTSLDLADNNIETRTGDLKEASSLHKAWQEQGKDPEGLRTMLRFGSSKSPAKHSIAPARFGACDEESDDNGPPSPPINLEGHIEHPSASTPAVNLPMSPDDECS